MEDNFDKYDLFKKMIYFFLYLYRNDTIPSLSFENFFGNVLVAFRYVWADTWKNKKSFIVGFATVCVVVFAVAYDSACFNLNSPISH